MKETSNDVEETNEKQSSSSSSIVAGVEEINITDAAPGVGV